MQEPDCFLRYRINYETLQPCLGCQRAALLRRILRRENRMYTLERAVVLKWFYSLSCRKTFIGVPSSFVGLIFCVTVKHLYRLNIYREPNVIWLRTQCKTCTKLGAVVQLVEYRTRNKRLRVRLTPGPLQTTLSKLLTYCVLRPTQPPTLSGTGNE